MKRAVPLKETWRVLQGKHIWIVCPECRRLIRLTGILRGWHICVEEDES